MVRDALWGRGVHHYQGNPPQLRYTPTADAASCCRGNPPQLRYMPTADAASRYRGNQPLLRYTPIADTACRCRGNLVQQRDSASGRSPQKQGKPHTAGRSPGRTRLPPSWAGQPGRHSKIKHQPLQKEQLRKKGLFLSSVAAELNIAA